MAAVAGKETSEGWGQAGRQVAGKDTRGRHGDRWQARRQATDKRRGPRRGTSQTRSSLST